MKDIIVVHKLYETISGGNWYGNFFEQLCDKFGFELRYTDYANIPSDARIVVAFAVPHIHWKNLMIDELSKLDSSIYLIGWMADIHCGDLIKKVNHECKKGMITMFDRYDLIISAHDTRMKSMYTKYLEKYVYVPWCFAPHERYMKFKLNKNPKIQCLMVGAHSGTVYPLRSKIHKYAQNHETIKSLRGNISKEKYPTVLHEYFCGIADTGHNEVIQPKYFEIPAVGSLLLGRRTNLVDDLGFIPYKHYVPFTGKDIFDKANDIISNPFKYEDIRIAGMEYVRKNHSINNRMEKVFDLIENIYTELRRSQNE
jgi:hypothetical protein